MENNFRILGIAGSLRRQSYNRAALAAATHLAPTGSTVETFDLAGIPPFNEDDEFITRGRDGFQDANPRGRRDLIRYAGVQLFGTRSSKNAIDWASRPYGDNAWFGKPAAIMGASVGSLGVRARNTICGKCSCF